MRLAAGLCPDPMRHRGSLPVSGIWGDGWRLEQGDDRDGKRWESGRGRGDMRLGVEEG